MRKFSHSSQAPWLSCTNITLELAASSGMLLPHCYGPHNMPKVLAGLQAAPRPTLDSAVPALQGETRGPRTLNTSAVNEHKQNTTPADFCTWRRPVEDWLTINKGEGRQAMGFTRLLCVLARFSQGSQEVLLLCTTRVTRQCVGWSFSVQRRVTGATERTLYQTPTDGDGLLIQVSLTQQTHHLLFTRFCAAAVPPPRQPPRGRQHYNNNTGTKGSHQSSCL